MDSALQARLEGGQKWSKSPNLTKKSIFTKPNYCVALCPTTVSNTVRIWSNTIVCRCDTVRHKNVGATQKCGCVTKMWVWHKNVGVTRCDTKIVIRVNRLRGVSGVNVIIINFWYCCDFSAKKLPFFLKKTKLWLSFSALKK
jgi:hypothetical protein